MSMHHGTIALSCIDDEDIFLKRAEEILKSYGGKIEDFRLADSGDFELSFKVPEEHSAVTRLLLTLAASKRGKVVH
jgi:hypothetical protein